MNYSPGFKKPVSILKLNPHVYDSNARLPNSSVGVASPNGNYHIATLMKYVVHSDLDGVETPFALINHHTADPDGDIKDPGEVKRYIEVHCPPKEDHQSTKRILKEEIRILKSYPVTALSPNQRPALEQTLKQAEAYDISFGHVFATSGANDFFLMARAKAIGHWLKSRIPKSFPRTRYVISIYILICTDILIQ